MIEYIEKRDTEVIVEDIEEVTNSSMFNDKIEMTNTVNKFEQKMKIVKNF